MTKKRSGQNGETCTHGGIAASTFKVPRVCQASSHLKKCCLLFLQASFRHWLGWGLR
jgi:hypothetical protein